MKRKESHFCIVAVFSIISFILINKNPSAATVNGASKKFMLVETPDGNKIPDFLVVETKDGKKSLIKFDGETGNDKNAQSRGGNKKFDIIESLTYKIMRKIKYS